MNNPEQEQPRPKSADLFDYIPDSAIQTIAPEAPTEILQELNQQIILESTETPEDIDQPDCDCGECLTCAINELVGDWPANSSDDEGPDEEEFEDDSVDFELGGEG